MDEDNLKRTVEVFTGAYASGKSESALNRALQYARRGKDITLVDLDTVEPAYCLRPIVEELKEKGISIIAQTRREATLQQSRLTVFQKTAI